MIQWEKKSGERDCFDLNYDSGDSKLAKKMMLSGQFPGQGKDGMGSWIKSRVQWEGRGTGAQWARPEIPFYLMPIVEFGKRLLKLTVQGGTETNTSQWGWGRAQGKGGILTRTLSQSVKQGSLGWRASTGAWLCKAIRKGTSEQSDMVIPWSHPSPLMVIWFLAPSYVAEPTNHRHHNSWSSGCELGSPDWCILWDFNLRDLT